MSVYVDLHVMFNITFLVAKGKRFTIFYFYDHIVITTE